MMRLLTLLPAILLAFPSVPAAVAGAAEEKGLAIAREAERRDAGYRDHTASGRMILRNSRGQESVREFRSSVLEVPDDGDKSLMVFDHPGDIRGTALLTIAHKADEDDQWLYLPALKRVKRISSGGRSGSFVGSEFTYEDLIPHEIEKHTYAWLRDEPCPGADDLQCFVYERRPVDRDSGYSREVVWRDQDEYRVFKVDYYDRKETNLKTLTSSDYQQYEGRFWRPDQMLMINHQNGKSTALQWSGYQFGTGLRDEDFTRRALERAR